MFLHDIWPKARIGLYCEWYREEALAAEVFDPEFPVAEQETAVYRLRFRNLNAALHVDMAAAGITPTRFQFASYPKVWQDLTSVIHDGIDTRFVCQNPGVALEISSDLTVTRNEEVISFINRNLESVVVIINLCGCCRICCGRDRRRASWCLAGMLSAMGLHRLVAEAGNSYI